MLPTEGSCEPYLVATIPPPSRPTARRVRIGVMVNNVGGYSRGVLRGVASFAFARAWECLVQGVNAKARTGADGTVDGIIAQATTNELASRLRESGTPVVNISSALAARELPTVAADDLAVGRMGADYFIRLGHRSLAFYAADEREFSRLRFDGFSTRASESAIRITRITTRDLADQLTRLPHPVGVMGSNDTAALVVLDACRSRGIKVPDQIAVLGVDNDDLVQSLAFPPLSSINMATERIGFEAAAMLETLLRGETPRQDRLLVPPTGVVTRQSTDLVAIADADVAEAVRFIRDHAGKPIGVNDVAHSVTISRRQLERRFRATLGRSVLEEIQRCRIDRARQLLTDTELTIPQVAMACGFSTPSYFTVAFRQLAATTPGVFREQHRSRRPRGE